MGMIIKNGVEYNFGSSNTDSSSMEIVTQAEYDALVANGTMDNDKYYFITDTSVGGNATGQFGDVSYVTGITHTSDVEPYLERIGNRIFLDLNIDTSGISVSTNTWFALATLPEGYRPLKMVSFDSVCYGGSNKYAIVARGEVSTTDGVIRIYIKGEPATTITRISIHTTFPVA